MADTPLPNIPYRVALTDESGFISPAWSAFFRLLYVRVGEANALTNTELAAIAGGGVSQSELDAVSNTVTANKASSDLSISNLSQGPVL
jgi:hypothetical protein